MQATLTYLRKLSTAPEQYVVDITNYVTSTNVTLPDTGVRSATYGAVDKIPQITVDTKGRITSATNIPLSIDWSVVKNKPTTLNNLLNAQYYTKQESDSKFALTTHSHPNYQTKASELDAISSLSNTTSQGYLKRVVSGNTVGYVVDSSISGSQSSYPDAAISSVSKTLVGDIAAIDSFNINTYRTLKYIIQASSSDGISFHSTEILLIHNGIDVYITEFADLITNGSLFTISSEINSNICYLYLTPSRSENIVVKAIKSSIFV